MKSSVSRVVRPRSAELRIGESGERASQKLDLRANPVRTCDSPGRLKTWPGTMAVIPSQHAQSFSFVHYLPPPSLRVKSPRSAKFGSFSSRAISSRSMVRNPLVRPLVAGRPWR